MRKGLIVRVGLYGLLAAGGLIRADGTATGNPKAPDPEYVEVTTSRIPERIEIVPASVTVITAQDLRNRGATDLRTAIQFAAGVEISPGGDQGPASSVPEFWGLREFDAFLLVVDGVPWGGAFNPSLATIDLASIQRIEVLRGAAPVMYGATSFVGVIQVIRNAPGEAGTETAFRGGSYGSGSLAASTDLPQWGRLSSSLAGTVEQVGYRDNLTQSDRGHLLWRGGLPLAGGSVRLDADATWLGQDPASPHPRVGRELTNLVPLDTNEDPEDSHLNERRLFFAGGLDHKLTGTANFSSTLSFTRSDQSIFRGFLTDVSNTNPNANGFRQGLDTSDVYFDAQVDFRPAKSVRLVTGVDHLHGMGFSRGGDFDYFIPLDGDNPPSPSQLPSQADAILHDRREFSGIYGFTEWTPADRWLFELGARLNRTVESRQLHFLDLASSTLTTGDDRREVTRGSGAAGVTFTAWQSKADALRLYADYRDTYKPAAIDFGIDSEAEILQPETAQSFELGVKARLLQGRLQPEINTFRMDFANLVVTQTVGGLPALTNAGKERFQGVEAEVAWLVTPDIQWRSAWSFHNARFRDFVTDFGGVATQLAGNRLEMSPRTMGATGILYVPRHGWVGSAQVNIVGNRYLDKRNTALVSSYATVAAGVGYRTDAWEYRLDGTNLTNQRPPVSESELGDSQYYRLPAVRVMLSVVYRGAPPGGRGRSSSGGAAAGR